MLATAKVSVCLWSKSRKCSLRAAIDAHVVLQWMWQMLPRCALTFSLAALLVQTSRCSLLSSFRAVLTCCFKYAAPGLELLSGHIMQAHILAAELPQAQGRYILSQEMLFPPQVCCWPKAAERLADGLLSGCSAVRPVL